MHLLAATPGSVTDGSEAVDLGQTPGDILFLSAADTELACLAQGYAQVVHAHTGAGHDGPFPSLRLATISPSTSMSKRWSSMRGWSWCG